MKSRILACLLVALTAWAQTSAPDVKLPEKGTIFGQVINAATGDPVRNVTVYVEGGQEVTSASTDADGRYEVSELDPGDYSVSVERDGYIRQTFGSRLILGPGGTVEAGFKLVKQSVVTGRVLTEDGEPAMRVIVELKKITYSSGKAIESSVAFATTDDRGEYRLFDVAPGKYIVLATKDPEFRHITRQISPPKDIYVPVYYPSTTDPQSATKIVVPKGGELHGLDITLQKVKSYTIGGTVVSTVSSSATGDRIVVSVSLSNEASSGHSPHARIMQAKADGSFEFHRVAPGTYEVQARFLLDDRALGVQELTVAGANATGVVVALQPRINVTGTVTMEGDTRTNLGHVSISLWPEREGGNGSSESEEDGSFEIANVPPFKVQLSFSQLPEGSYVKRVTVEAVDVTGKILDLAALHGTPISILLSPKAAAISGTVKNDKDEIVTKATVVLVPDAPNRSRHELYKTATLDQYGHYKITSITPGSYDLFAFQNVEDGMWEDADFLNSVEEHGTAFSLSESDQQSSDLEVIVGDDG